MQGRTAAAAGGSAAAGQMYPAVHEGRAGDAMHGDGQGFEGIPAGLVGSLADRHFLFNPRLSLLEMGYRFEDSKKDTDKN